MTPAAGESRPRAFGPAVVACAVAISALCLPGVAPATAAPTGTSAGRTAAAAAETPAKTPVSAPRTGVPGGSGVPGVPTPPVHYEQTTQCVQPSNVGATVRNGVSWAQQQLDYTSLWTLGDRGAGQTVAVIDTGVSQVGAFGDRLHGGGDYVVQNGTGLDDCDGHGTVVAALIAAAPDRRSGFAGVAPAARLLSIRQSSSHYGVKNAKRNEADTVAGNTASLAEAIERAVTLGATVINISEASCRRASVGDPGEFAVRAAVADAVSHDVVVVAAAGNVDSSSDCTTQNVPGTAPSTLAIPARLPGVLAVAAVDRAGRPAAFTLAGPWVDVAAPGVSITSTDPLPGSTGQINRFVSSPGVAPIQGTSFAAPYVAGLVALVRNRFPDLRAAQVIERITRTAEHPAAPGGRNDLVGYGTIDPEAALTAVLPGETPPSPAARSGPQTLPAAPARADPDRHARAVSLTGSLGLGVALLVGLVVMTTRRRRADLLASRSAGRARAVAGARWGR